MLNENIKAIRKLKGLSQQELAVKLNVVRQTISKWEQGLSVPDSDMLIAISEALETPVSKLLGETVVETEEMCIRDRLSTQSIPQIFNLIRFLLKTLHPLPANWLLRFLAFSFFGIYFSGNP